MARPLRIEYPGAVYHVMSRGDGREAITVSEDDSVLFLNVLAECVERYNLLIHGYCLMPNHYHLLVETPDGNLSDAMRFLNGVYTQRFNSGHKTVGHVFQGRFKSIVVNRDEYLMCLCRYIERNPVRAGIVEHPKDYPWSSYRIITGVGGPSFVSADWILSQFAPTRQEAIRRYSEYVLAPDADNDRPFGKVKGGCFLGSDEFVSRFNEDVWDSDEIKEITRQHRHVNRPPLDALLSDGLPKTERDLKAYEAVYEFGYKQKEVAEHLGLHYAYISRVIAEASKRLNSKT